MSNGQGKDVALLGAGVALGVVGGGLAALFATRPVEAAPDTTKLEYIATLLETLNRTEADVLAAIKSLSLGGVPGVPGTAEVTVAVTTPWTAKEPAIIFQQALRSAGVFFSDDLVDYRNSKRLAFKVESTLDQPVIIQLMGNFDKSWQLAIPMDGPFPCPANGNIDIGLAWDDWRPFVGVRITVGAPPLSGMLTIRQVLQE